MEVLDLHRIKELLEIEKIPIDSISMGPHSESKRRFITKYGIDNIIRLDEETNGMFSHTLWGNDIYLTVFAISDSNTYAGNEENSKDINSGELSYDDFKNRMYEILLHAREKGQGIETGVFADYDFITGSFRDEHPDIFIDGVNVSIKNKFYRGHMSAEDIRQNPELIQILQGKKVNMAKYVIEKIGQEEFLRICADYGKCLDSISLSISRDFTLESIREKIEDAIYGEIKDKGMVYFEELPSSFKEKHPDLFLPEEVDEKLRNKFYSGDLTFEDVRQNPQLREILLSKDIGVGFGNTKCKPLRYGQRQREVRPMWEKLTEQEIIYFAEKYGEFLEGVNAGIFVEGQSKQDKERAIQQNIEENILTRKSPFIETIPDFFKKRRPEMFLDDEAPELLKTLYYNNKLHDTNVSIKLNFELIKRYPEWKEFLQGKDIRLAFMPNYDELFRKFDSDTLMKLGARDPVTIDKMVSYHRVSTLESWYKATGGRFLPNFVVMINFPEEEIDSFLANGKKWSKLMTIDFYNRNNDGKAALLKAAYSMGVFQGDNEGFNRTMELFAGLPKDLSAEEYEQVMQSISYNRNNKELQTILEQAYKIGKDGKYNLSFNAQSDKNRTKTVRGILEEADFPRILTPIKAHQIFDSFKMEYNPDFVKFFVENCDEILSNPEYRKDIATMQRQFKDIVRTNAGRKLTWDVAQAYIRSIVYSNIDIGNEGVAEQAKIAGYSQEDFEAIQKLFNEGETRDFSSIPRIQGKTNGYTYEMLRCDDPLALTIGTLTDCCQEIHGAGQTSMEHSVVSPDGRVFCVKDEEGRLVAQSWFWRNQYTGCFDNIEIPNRIFRLYETEHPDKGRKGLAAEVLGVYKKAAQDLMEEDKRVYQELLKSGDITQEQYDSLVLGKVTIGLGYNDIASAIKSDKTIHQESDTVGVKSTRRLPNPYTDAKIQYTIAERDGIVESKQENLYVHQDDIPLYDSTNMTDRVLLTLRRMDRESENNNTVYFNETGDDEQLKKSERLMNTVAEEYGLDPNTTRVLATARMAIIYSQDDEKIKIGNVLSSPLREGLTEEQKQKAENHIRYQVKKALKQIGAQDAQVDMSSLSVEKRQMVKSVMEEIRKESDERDER